MCNHGGDVAMTENMTRRGLVTKHQTSSPYMKSMLPVRTNGITPTSTNACIQSTNRYSMMSLNSLGDRSALSADYLQSAIPRPSGIPRSTTLNRVSAAKKATPSVAIPITSTKSTSTPALDHKATAIRRQSLRTMQTAQIKQALRRREDGTSQPSTVSVVGSIGIGVTAESLISRRQSQVISNTLPPRLIPELQALAHTNRRPVQTPSSVGSTSSPSTQFTGSSSPWSASTNTTISTSWSSTSPSILQTSRSPANSKRSYTVPIPATSKSRLPGVPILQETTPGSTSASRTNLRREDITPPKKLRKSPAPTPPPRSSSVKRGRSRSNSKDNDLLSTNSNVTPPPLPSRSEQRSFWKPQDQIAGNEHHTPTKITAYHHDLQKALYDDKEDRHLDEMNTQYLATEHNIIGPQDSNESSRSLLDSAPIRSISPVVQTPRSRLAKFSKFALFGRSNKDTIATDEAKLQPRKLQRKGPTAGTGHEGYGKYGRKAKKVSGDSSSGGTDSEGSVTSTRIKSSRLSEREKSSSSSRRDRNSQSDLDDFAASRMKPVIIVGGSQQTDGKVRNSYSIFDTHSHVQSSPHIDDGSMQYMPSPEVLSKQVPTAVPHAVALASPVSSSHPAESKGSLESYRLPDVSGPSIHSTFQPYASSINVSQSSFTPSYVTSTDAGSTYRGDANIADKHKKRIRRSKWNIFRRKDSSLEQDIATVEPQVFLPTSRLAVSVAEVPVSRTVPYYAMLEPENETIPADMLDNFLTEANQTGEADDEDGFGTPDLSMDPNTRERVESVLLPSVPLFNRELSRSRKKRQPALRLLTPAANGTISSEPDLVPRQPRLAQVGRIPKVVSNSAAKSLNRKSFSRLFSQFQQADSHEIYSSVNDTLHQASITKPELLPSAAYIAPTQQRPKDSSLDDSLTTNSHDEQRFSFELGKSNDRQSVTSSSSSGMISVMGPSLLPPAIENESLKRATVAEEDVWNEYDDFLDHVTSEARWQASGGKRHEPERIASGEWQAGRQLRAKDTAPSLIALAKGLAVNTSVTQIPIYLESPDLLEGTSVEKEVRLRRSRIVSALHDSYDPSSPFSIGDYLTEQSDWHRNSGSQSSHQTDIMPSTKPHAPAIALPAVPETHHYDHTSHMNDAQRVKNPVKHSELSYASLMISRWLSFGQVLFSPAHSEIQRQPEKQILVIDGLGNDDWSLYCAVTYQSERAYVYDFKETGIGRQNDVRKTNIMPPNFRRRGIADFNGVFNFPDNFFSVIVFRFPPVMADAKLRNIISECRRILAPGGYLELMLLDLDIVNMGVSTRRAMRNLKTKMTMSNPDVSLRPLIDNIQNVLGEKSFAKFSRCVVGVPVVGTPANSADSPVSSRSSGGSEQASFSPSAGPRPFDSIAAQNPQGFSLRDLVADHSDGADAKIGKLVSRTARSWWQHCFEADILSEGSPTRSMLASKQVLTECKSRASSFKLLIAHAQKPLKPAVEARRRTMSEPLIATIAPS